MDNTILDFISQFITLSENEARIISEQNIIRHYKKNEVLLAEGETAKDCFFVIKGCVRAFYIKNGEEKNPGGASLMIKDGVLENPKPQAILALHVNTILEVGQLSFRGG